MSDYVPNLSDIERIIDRLADVLDDDSRSVEVRREAATHQTSVLSVAVGGANPARIDSAVHFLSIVEVDA